MKKIIEARKLLGVDKNAELKDLKTIYRNFMKDWHPDKIQNDEEKKLQAEEKSKELIEAYHLLVSVAPETHQQQLEKYTESITNRNTYLKLVNSATPDRFLRRHVYHEFVYRKVTKAVDQN
jgi:curved DNA-binding protein CbpA